MSVVVRQMIAGKACRLMAWGDEKGSDLVEFLIDLKRRNLAAHRKLLAELDRLAQHGEIGNPQKYRYFRELGAFEIKTRDGVRVMAFWDENQLVVCTHAFIKKSQKTKRSELERLRARKAEYFAAKSKGQLIFE